MLSCVNVHDGPLMLTSKYDEFVTYLNVKTN